MWGLLFTFFICFWTFVFGMIVAWFVVIQKLKLKEHEETILKERPIDLPLNCDFDNSDSENTDELPSIFAYLKKSPQSSNTHNDQLSSSKRRVVVSKEVDLAIEKLIEELIEYYLFSWYKPLVQLSNPTNEIEERLPTESVNQLRQVLKNDIWLLLSAFIDRFYSANYVHFFAISFVNRIIKHVQLLNCQKAMQSSSSLLPAQNYEPGTFQSYISSQSKSHSSNQFSSKYNRTFSTQSSNTSLSSASSNSSLSTSPASPSLHSQQPATHIASNLAEPESDNSQLDGKTIIFQLVSHLASVSAEHKLISRLAYFIVDILCKEALEKKSILEKSMAFKLMLSKFVSVAILNAINRVSDPAFINYQIVQLIRKRINIKDLIPVEEPVTADLRSLSSSFSVYDLKICLSEHNFNRLMEILDHCDDMDSLKTIRMHIIEEILDVAVIEYINKQQNESQRHYGGSSTNSKSLSPFNRKRSFDSTHSSRNASKSGLFQQLRNTASGTLPFPGTSKNTQKEETLNEAEMFGALQQHFNFNANINSKVKVLQTKDLRRLISKLRYAKAICEQKIQVHKRHSALLIPECSETINSPLSANAYEDSKFSFDISFNSELVRSFRRSSVGEADVTDAATVFPNLKPKKKNIFKFKVIMANDFCRQYFKRFLQESLFNLQSGEFHRSSRNKFRKDILICECCVYLVDVWETIQEVFDHFYHYYHASTSVQSQRQSRQFADFHSLFAYCYHLILQTVADSRFYYTFSQQFLHLPNDVMKSLEAFLLGDVELTMLKRTFEDFSIESFATRLDFSSENHQQLANSSLSRIDIPKYLNVFHLLENIIFKCLCDEFYPQFLISTEYDEMLYNHASNTIDVNREIASSRWCSTVFSNFDTVDHVLNKQFASMLSSNPKAIHKIQLEGDQVDIVKNRSILLNCLEFPFFCLTSMQFIVQQRLSLKMYMKNFITQICSSNTEVAPLFIEVAQVLSRDIVYYNDIYSHLHLMICSTYCFLHSKFTCNISDVQVHPIQRTSSSLENKIITFVENIFSSDGASSSSASTASHSSTSSGQIEQNYRLVFCINSTAISSPGCDHLHAFVRSQLTSHFNNTWSTKHSFDGLIELFSKWMTPNLRMMAYLSHTGLFDFVHCLGKMMEPKTPKALTTAMCYDKSVFSKLEETDKQAYWEKLMKKLANDQIAVKRLFRQEVRDKIKLEKQKTKPQFSERLSFKKLLDKESGSINDSPEARINTATTSNSPQSSEHLDKITYYLNQFFSRLTIDNDLIKTNGFLNLVQYEVCPSVSQSIIGNDSASLCLRCQLIEHLIEHNIDDLNAFILQSLCLLSFKSGVDPQPLISPATHSEATETNRESSREKPKLLNALAFPQQATKLFLQNTNSLPKVQGFNQSGQLLFLHARSLLTERSSAEVLDYTLSAFRHFDKFCSSCSEKLYSNSQSLSELRTNASSAHRRKTKRIKFRLFNIDTQQQTSHQHRSAEGSEVGTDVVASLKSGSITEASSSLLHENIGSSLFGGDGFEPMEPFAFGLGEEFESNLIEPLFQLLIEVFELKGTMIRTFRRTVMFGFRLIFGQTLFSRQIKMSLEHFFTDANILQMISTLQETVHGWNEELEKSTESNKMSTANSGGGGSANKLRHRRNASQTVSNSESNANNTIASNASAYLNDLNELLNTFSPLLDNSLATDIRTSSLNTESPFSSKPETSFSVSFNEPSVLTTNFPQSGNVNAHFSEKSTTLKKENANSDPTEVKEDQDSVNIARLQILAKQLLFASVPSFLNHLFGAENTITGLNKTFDILQYQKLNKQLIYEFLEAFLIEYYPEFKKI